MDDLDFNFDPDKFKKDQDDAKSKKDLFGALGTVAQGLQSVPSSYQMLYGGKSSAPDVKSSFDQMSKDVVDPSERQMKLYQAYKSAKDAEKSSIDLDNAQVAQNDSEDAHDVDSDKNKAFRQSIMATAPQIAKAMGPSFNSVTVADKENIWDPIKLKEQMDARKQQAALQFSQKNDEKVDKLAKAFKDDMDANKGRSGNFGQISAKVQAADRLKGLVDSYKDGNLPPAQMEELALGMANMLAGSTGSSRAQVEALVPHTWYGKAQDVGQWLTNEPRGAGQQKFVDQMMHTIDREREIANTQLNAIRKDRLGAHARFKQLAPDQFNQMVSQYGIDPNSGGTKTSMAQSDTHQLAGPMIDSAKAAQFPPGVQEYADQHGLSPDVAYKILKNRGDVK